MASNGQGPAIPPPAASAPMKRNDPDPHGLVGANPYKPVGGGGQGEAAGGSGTYGSISQCDSGGTAIEMINRSVGKGVSDTNNPAYRGGNYSSK